MVKSSPLSAKGWSRLTLGAFDQHPKHLLINDFCYHIFKQCHFPYHTKTLIPSRQEKKRSFTFTSLPKYALFMMTVDPYPTTSILKKKQYKNKKIYKNRKDKSEIKVI